MPTLEKPAKTDKVMFVCPGGYELTLVMKSEDFVAVEGRAIKVHPKRINFGKRAFGGEFRGEFVTNDPEIIDWLRAHEWYRSGPIPQDQPIYSARDGSILGYKQTGATGTIRPFWEVNFIPETIRQVPEIVHRTGDANPDIPQAKEAAPSDEPQIPTKARISKILRKNLPR